MATDLSGILDYLRADNDLRNGVSTTHFNRGMDAAEDLTDLLANAIDRTGVNDDGLIDADDIQRLASSIRARNSERSDWRDAHGSENGESGFHLLRGDGGTQLFRNTGYVDQVADAIFSIGFGITNGRVRLENGNAGRDVDEVAGWLNFFVNGKTAVYGTSSGETLYHSRYHADYIDAESEIFYAGGGSDSVWAGTGQDVVYLGGGNDRADGGDGRDRMYGGSGNDYMSGGGGDDRMYAGKGNDEIGSGLGDDLLYGGKGTDMLVSHRGEDTLYGGTGNDQLESWWDNDRLYGMNGNDKLYAGDGRDRLYGGEGRDSLFAEDGADLIFGGQDADSIWGYTGNDTAYGGRGNDRLLGMEDNDILRGDKGRDDLFGGTGADRLYGGGGDDTLWGQNGSDTMMGGKGADTIMMWETSSAADTIVFRPGDSGRATADVDRVEGFAAGDRIDLTAFDNLQYRADDFRGGGRASAYYDGENLRIDTDGDRDVDMRIYFAWTSDLRDSDFIL